jgi:hypothetical protein
MSKILTTLLLTLCLSVGAAWAGDFEDDELAYDAKKYSLALKNATKQTTIEKRLVSAVKVKTSL